MKPHEYVILEIARERERQMAGEGWTPEHDNVHTGGQMAKAAACYAFASTIVGALREVSDMPTVGDARTPTWFDYTIIRRLWAWEKHWFKPKDPRRDLVRAGALIVAEIERLDRAAGKDAA